jgi:HEAT repeat protein
MKKLLAVMLVAGAFTAGAASVAWAAAADDLSAARDRTRETLLYGIDSQVLDAIKAIKSSKDSSFTKELSQVLSTSLAADVQAAVLDVFQDQKIPDGEDKAKQILSGWQDASSAVLSAAIRYLAAIDSKGLAASLGPLVDSSDAFVASAAIQSLGASGDPAAAALLLGKLKSADFPDARRSDAILAIGELKDPNAVDMLIALAKNPDEDKVRRMYAADALGKIGDAKAIPVLKSMFAENDALVRLYAVSAIARFGLDSSYASLMQGLRDESWKVREASAKALGSAGQATGTFGDAVPILVYKAKLDPISQVRLASIQALGGIGGQAATNALLGIYGSSDSPLESRETALTVLVGKSLPASLGAIRKVISDEWKSYDPAVLQSTAKVISTVKDPSLRDIFIGFLDSSDAVVRSYGARGIAANQMFDLRDRLKKISVADPNPGTRKEAELALGKL